MSEINASNFKKEHGNLAPDLVGVTELTSPIYFVPPSGTTAERPEDCEPGTLRFNTDIGSLEVFRGKTIGWEQIQRREGQYLGGSNAAQAGSNKGTGTRGLYFGGSGPAGPSGRTQIDFLTINTLGSSQDFGDLATQVHNGPAGMGSRVRGNCCGGSSPSTLNDIQSVFFSSTGAATDYGTISSGSRKEHGGFSNHIRGVVGGGGHSTMDFYEMASGGNTADFGDITQSEQNGGMCNSTRGIFCISVTVPAYSRSNAIEFVTIMTKGDTQEFGDLTVPRYGAGTHANATRGIFVTGYQAPQNTICNHVDFIQIATTGNAIDFGDRTVESYSCLGGGMASKTRAVQAGGHQHPNPSINVIDYVEFSTTGNFNDFGDLTAALAAGGQCSNGHGGL